MAAPTFVNSTVAAGGTSIVINVPTGTANGDLLLLGVSQWGAAVAQTGWTLIAEYPAGSGFSIWLYGRIASSEPASYTISAPANSGSEARLCMHAWRPSSGSWASVAAAIAGSGAHFGDRPDDLTFANCDYAAVIFGGRSGGYDALAVPSGFTARGTTQGGSGQSQSIISGSKNFTATTNFAGSSEAQWTYGGPVSLNTATVAIKTVAPSGRSIAASFIG